ncbi:hypothetical protein DC3_28930 [Deinococcus cellulosilyticus NBRC 106333 = KACC 11606]|uniref:Uncharacterized protein n=2 Tax=Deinococcus cellulosilyticus TaxID=401558 RepID=A0A511N462_DEIC1|nr:hypothetical protein DC3_28930 [Deinococcus cellulosilyticus NBRC 106333 = KACC 11606]
MFLPLVLSSFLGAIAFAQNNPMEPTVVEMEREDIKKICLVAVSYALLGDVFEPDLERNELYYVPAIKKWKMVVTNKMITPQGDIKQTVVCYVSGSPFKMVVETVIK